MLRSCAALARAALASLSAVLFAAPALPQGEAPPTGHYTITQEGKTLGKAEYTLAPIRGGATVHSSGSMALKSFSYAFDNTATIDAESNLAHDLLTGSVHGAKASGNDIRFQTTSDSTGRSFSIEVNSGGVQTGNTLERDRNTVLVPDLDPGAYFLMARVALRHPQSAWVLIPKQNGILVPAEYTNTAPLHGTLAGHPVSIQHTVVAIGGENALVIELFYTASGDLLEADLNAQNLRVTRDGFILQDRPHPVAPPHGQAPQQDQPTTQREPSQPEPQ